MAIQEKDVTWVEEPRIGFWEATFLPAIVEGLRTTAGHVLRKHSVTQQFPEEKPDLPLNYRGVHRLNRDEEGRVKCVACYMCATACPAHCIYIDAAAAPWEDRDKYPESFVIDELKCIYCGMCEEACPCDAIELTSVYDIAGLSREEMLFDKEKLLSMYDQTVNSGKDPNRTHRGELGVASEIENPPLLPPTPVKNFNNGAKPVEPQAAVIAHPAATNLDAKKTAPESGGAR